MTSAPRFTILRESWILAARLRAVTEPEIVTPGSDMDAVTKIRRVAANEGAMLLALWNAAGATPSPTDTLEDIERGLGGDRLDCFAAEIDGEVVGSIIAAFDGWRGYIYRMAVHPAYRRRGIARRLVERAHESFARWGAKRVTALVETDHPWALSFWNAVGYVHDEKMARFVRKDPSEPRLSQGRPSP